MVLKRGLLLLILIILFSTFSYAAGTCQGGEDNGQTDAVTMDCDYDTIVDWNKVTDFSDPTLRSYLASHGVHDLPEDFQGRVDMSTTPYTIIDSQGRELTATSIRFNADGSVAEAENFCRGENDCGNDVMGQYNDDLARERALAAKPVDPSALDTENNEDTTGVGNLQGAGEEQEQEHSSDKGSDGSDGSRGYRPFDITRAINRALYGDRGGSGSILWNMFYGDYDFRKYNNTKEEDPYSLDLDHQSFIEEKDIDYYVGSAGYWSTPKYKIVKGSDIIAADDCMVVGDGETIETNEAFVSDAKWYENCDEEVYLGGAKAVFVDGMIFEDLQNSDFKLDGDSVAETTITSSKDKNEFLLKDETVIIADSGERFKAVFKEDGTIIRTDSAINLTNNHETIITMLNPTPEILNLTNTSNASVMMQGESFIEIDEQLGVTKILLAPSSRYINYDNTTFNPPFSIYTFPNEYYALEIIKHPDQKTTLDMSNCTQCGVVDYVNNYMQLNGKFEFEREHLKLPIFTNIIQSLDYNNTIKMNMDFMMEVAEDLEFEGGKAHFFSGQFEVLRINKEVYYKFRPKGTPYSIKFIQPNIFIRDYGVLNRYEDENIFTMYARGNEETGKFIDRYESWLFYTGMEEDYQDTIAPKELWAVTDHVSDLWDLGPFRYAWLVNVE